MKEAKNKAGAISPHPSVVKNHSIAYFRGLFVEGFNYKKLMKKLKEKAFWLKITRSKIKSMLVLYNRKIQIVNIQA